MALDDSELRDLRLDPEMVRSVAAAESSFGLAYLKVGRLAAAGTLLTSAACHFALVDSAKSVEAFTDAVDAFRGLRHAFAIVPAAASGDARLIDTALRAPRHDELRLRMELRLGEERDPAAVAAQESGVEDGSNVDPSDDEYAAYALGEVLRGVLSQEAVPPQDDTSIVDLVDLVDIPDRPLWSGLVTASELQELFEELQHDGFSERGANVLSRAATALAVYQRDDFHWSNLVGPPVYAVEVLALSQLLIGDHSERVDRYPASIARPLRLAASLRAVTSDAEGEPEADDTPSQVLLTAWEQLEAAVLLLATRTRSHAEEDLFPRVRADLASLQNNGLIRADTLAAVSRLEELYSRVADGTHKPTSGEATVYAESMTQLSAELRAQAATADAPLAELMQRWRTFSPQNAPTIDRIVAGLAERGYRLVPSRSLRGGPGRTYMRALAPDGSNLGYLNSTTFTFVAARGLPSIQGLPVNPRSGRYPNLPLSAPGAADAILAVAEEYWRSAWSS